MKSPPSAPEQPGSWTPPGWSSGVSRGGGNILPNGNGRSIISHGPEATHEIGRIIGRLTEPGDIVLLSGPLGAGKTCLTQGIADGLGIKETPISPTFVLMRQYHGRLPLYHIDLYRLEFAEIGDLGLDDYLAGEGVCAIEWAEKGLNLMPLEHLLIRLAYIEGQKRQVTLIPAGQRYHRLTADFARAWSPSGIVPA